MVYHCLLILEYQVLPLSCLAFQIDHWTDLKTYLPDFSCSLHSLPNDCFLHAAMHFGHIGKFKEIYVDDDNVRIYVLLLIL